MDKPKVRIENWKIMGNKLYGEAYSHPRFEDGTKVITSPIIKRATWLRLEIRCTN